MLGFLTTLIAHRLQGDKVEALVNALDALGVNEVHDLRYSTEEQLSAVFDQVGIPTLHVVRSVVSQAVQALCSHLEQIECMEDVEVLPSSTHASSTHKRRATGNTAVALSSACCDAQLPLPPPAVSVKPPPLVAPSSPALAPPSTGVVPTTDPSPLVGDAALSSTAESVGLSVGEYKQALRLDPVSVPPREPDVTRNEGLPDSFLEVSSVSIFVLFWFFCLCGPLLLTDHPD